jgi:hypothetical protein
MKRGERILTIIASIILIILLIFIFNKINSKVISIQEANCAEGLIASSCLCQSQVRTSGYCCNNLYYKHGCLDRYGGYKGIKSLIDSGYSGFISSISQNSITDDNANYQDNVLAGRYLVFNNMNFSDPSNSTVDKKFLITGNTRTMITTQVSDGDLTKFASSSNEYAITKLNPYFTTEKIGNRWWFVTPEGNAFYLVSSNNACAYTSWCSDGVDRSMKSYNYYVTQKYGSIAQWEINTSKRLKSWGFNSPGYRESMDPLQRENTNGYINIYMPHAYPVKMGYYSMDTRCEYSYNISNILQNIVGGNSAFPDVFSPNWINAIRNYSSNYTNRWTSGVLGNERFNSSSWVLGYYTDEELRGFGDRERHPHLGWAVMAQNPILTISSSCYGSINIPVYSKIAARNYLRRIYGPNPAFNEWLKNNPIANTEEWQSAPGWSSADDLLALQALSTSWGKAYTSWDSDGGYARSPNENILEQSSKGTGVLDENMDSSNINFRIKDSKGIDRDYSYWYSSDDIDPAYKEIPYNSYVSRDLDGILYEFSLRYFNTTYETIKSFDKNHLILGPMASSGNKLGTRKEIIDAMKLGNIKYVDALGVGLADKKTSPGEDYIYNETKNHWNYIYKTLGIPVFIYTFWLTAEPDSNVYYNGTVLSTIQKNFTFSGNLFGSIENSWILFNSVPKVAGKISSINYSTNTITLNGIFFYEKQGDYSGYYTSDWNLTNFYNPIQQVRINVLPGDSFEYLPTPEINISYKTQGERGNAYQGLLKELSNVTSENNYNALGQMMWKYSDNGFSYAGVSWYTWLDFRNMGLVTVKDNAYDGKEATKLGADGVSGTWDDESSNFGDFITSVAMANKNIYNIILSNPFCGDKACNSNEICSSCQEDCGSCPRPPAVNTTTNKGGGSGGGSSIAEEINITIGDLTIEQEIIEKETIKINLNGTHTITINNVTNDSATMTIASTPMTFKMNVGEKRKIDLENDSFYDLLLRLKSIRSNKANITLTRIREPIFVISQAEDNKTSSSKLEERGENKTTEEINIIDEGEQENPSLKSNYLTVYITASIISLLIIIVIFLLYMQYKKSKHLREMRENFYK